MSGLNQPGSPVRVLSETTTRLWTGVNNGNLSPEQLQRLLLYAHLAALDLPKGEPPHTDPPAGPSHKATRAAVERTFPQLGLYWTVLDPCNMLSDGELGTADAVDDLADVLLDLDCGLRTLHADGESAAGWQWRLSHRSHWGVHLVDLLGVLQRIDG